MAHAEQLSYDYSSAELVYALNELGVIVHISAVASGKACKCRCPECKISLVAKKGRLLTHHFAHDTDASCAGAPETALHKYAKQIVAKNLRLILPDIAVSYESKVLKLWAGHEVKFDGALEEYREFKQFVPDVFLLRDGRKLLIEVAVTHFCDEAKIAEIRTKGIAAIEIDLSKVPRDAAPDVVSKAVLREAPRYWLFHPQIDDAVSKMQSTAKQQAKAVQDRKIREINEFALEYRKGTEEISKLSPVNIAKTEDLYRLGLVDHRTDGNTKLFRRQRQSSKPSRNFHGTQAVEMNLIEVFHIVFLQSFGIKLHTKFCMEVSDRTRKETSDDLQMAHIKVQEKTARR